MPRKPKPAPDDRVRVRAPAGHTHNYKVLAEPTEITLRRAQAERFGFPIIDEAPNG